MASFFKPCPKVFIQVLWLRVVVKVVLNAKITDPKYLWVLLGCLNSPILKKGRIYFASKHSVKWIRKVSPLAFQTFEGQPRCICDSKHSTVICVLLMVALHKLQCQHDNTRMHQLGYGIFHFTTEIIWFWGIIIIWMTPGWVFNVKMWTIWFSCHSDLCS